MQSTSLFPLDRFARKLSYAVMSMRVRFNLGVPLVRRDMGEMKNGLDGLNLNKSSFYGVIKMFVCWYS